MSSDRGTYKYQFVGPDQRIKHSGITNDLKRRAHPPGRAALSPLIDIIL